ncbi:MAG: AAA-like domain-containing protein [Synechococcus sp.]
MSEHKTFSWEEARDFADLVVFEHTGKHLTDLEVRVLQGAWNKQTYDRMAEDLNYGAGYLNRDVGNPLWRKLSKALDEKVSKLSFSEALRRAWKARHSEIQNSLSLTTQSSNPNLTSQAVNLVSISVETTEELTGGLIEGPLPPGSSLYVVREGVEETGYRTVDRPGSLIRIKAPRLMGKTSLVYNLMAFAEAQGCVTMYLDFRSCDRSILTDLEKMLRWLCVKITRQLKLPNRLDEFWDSDIFGSNDNCTAYFEEYLLDASNSPLVLALDNVDRLFSYREITDDFFGMLRSWHEKGRISPIWQKLRLILSHSTEAYIPLDYNQSPFNTGVPISLPEFTAEQILQVSQKYRISLDADNIAKLQREVGGHPYLIRLAFHEISQNHTPLPDLFETSSLLQGIYSDHLRRLWLALQDNDTLIEALKTTTQSQTPVSLDPIQAYKLHSMGLIDYFNNRVAISCSLYQRYFDLAFSELYS